MSGSAGNTKALFTRLPRCAVDFQEKQTWSRCHVYLRQIRRTDDFLPGNVSPEKPLCDDIAAVPPK